MMGPATWYLWGRLVSRCSEGISGIGTQERDLSRICMDRGSLQPWEWKRLPRTDRRGQSMGGQRDGKSGIAQEARRGLSRAENSPWLLGCGASSGQGLQIDEFRNLPVKPSLPASL